MHIAVDLGALSGRVMLGHFGGDELILREAHRFAHPMTASGGHLRWDVPHIVGEIQKGIALAVEDARRRGRAVRLHHESLLVDMERIQIVVNPNVTATRATLTYGRL